MKINSINNIAFKNNYKKVTPVIHKKYSQTPLYLRQDPLKRKAVSDIGVVKSCKTAIDKIFNPNISDVYTQAAFFQKLGCEATVDSNDEKIILKNFDLEKKQLKKLDKIDVNQLFSNVKAVEGMLDLDDLPNLTNIDSIERVGKLSAIGPTALLENRGSKLASAKNLKSAKEIYLYHNRTLKGLDSLEHIDELWAQSSNLASAKNLRTAKYIIVTDNTKIKDFESLCSVDEMHCDYEQATMPLNNLKHFHIIYH